MKKEELGSTCADAKARLGITSDLVKQQNHDWQGVLEQVDLVVWQCGAAISVGGCVCDMLDKGGVGGAAEN